MRKFSGFYFYFSEKRIPANKHMFQIGSFKKRPVLMSIADKLPLCNAGSYYQ